MHASTLKLKSQLRWNPFFFCCVASIHLSVEFEMQYLLKYARIWTVPDERRALCVCTVRISVDFFSFRSVSFFCRNATECTAKMASQFARYAINYEKQDEEIAVENRAFSEIKPNKSAMVFITSSVKSVCGKCRQIGKHKANILMARPIGMSTNFIRLVRL